MHKLKYLTKLDKQHWIILLIPVIITAMFAVVFDWRFSVWLVAVVLNVVINFVLTKIIVAIRMRTGRGS